jgi:hypothetical protein
MTSYSSTLSPIPTLPPYDVYEGFYKSRNLHRLHPGWRARQTLFECLETRKFEFVWELHWGSRTAILWDLTKKKRVDEVKLEGDPDARETTKLIFNLMMKLKISDLPCLEDLVMMAFTASTHTLIWWPPKLYTDLQFEKMYSDFFHPHNLKNHIFLVDKKQKVPHTWFRFRELNATVFAYEDLAFNITKHILMTQYEVVPKNEVKPSDFPKLPTLLMTDPVCIFHGWQEDTLLRVKSVTGQPTFDYRVVRSQHFQPETKLIKPQTIPSTFRRRTIRDFMQ